MYRNFFKIAVRNLLRNKAFSAINIAGLAIGMASALLIQLWIQDEVNYDRQYPKTDRLYMIYNRSNIDGQIWAGNQTPQPMAPLLRKDYPAVEVAARYGNTSFLLTAGETHLNSQGVFADSGFISMFDFPMIKGDPVHALDGAYNIVVSERLAKSLFGSQDPMGKIIRIDSANSFMVAGVMKDLPENTDFKFDYLLPWSFFVRLGWTDQSWGNNTVWTYVLLRPGASQAAFDAQVKNITRNHDPKEETTEVFTQPMSRLHLYSKAEEGRLVGGKIAFVRLFAAIAGFILLIACINFMNLSTARSERRAREVGVRKVVGALRSGLVSRFIGESVLVSAIAFFLALVLAQISLGSFNQLVGKQLSIDFASPAFWFFSLGFVLFTGLLAGSYPAFYLSAFQPVKVLKGTFKKADALVSTRKVLVVLQFTFAIILIICTLLIRQQIQYAEDRDAGYDRNNLVYTWLQGDAVSHYLAIRNELLTSGAAIAANRTSGPVTEHWSDGTAYAWDGSNKEDETTDFLQLNTDADFVKTTGTTLVMGRDIDVYNYPTDTGAVVINEAAVRVMRLKNPLGVTIRRGGQNQVVVGVIKDFILESPYSKNISPMFIKGPRWYGYIMNIKLNPAHSISSDIDKATKIFKAYNPLYPFSVTFADKAYEQKFKDEQRMGTLAALFAGLTIFISCLGLFALATYMAENRIREIGVRKVLGASVTSITTLLTRDFVTLVLVAFIIAAPVAWYAMDQWLGNFGYRIDIGWTVFALSGGLALLIAVLTVSYQAIRAAVANPAKSLRTE
jgi:putative ABC transport system permease protein